MKKIGIAIIALIAFSCSKEQDYSDQNSKKVPASIAASIQNTITKVTTSGDAASGFTSAFADGDAIGIFVVKRSNPTLQAFPAATGNYVQNAKWVYSTTAGWTPATTNDKLWIEQNGTYDIYAYYPYVAGANPTAISYDCSLSGGMNDLMTARTTGVTTYTANISLIFVHKLTLIQVEATRAGLVPLFDNSTFNVSAKVRYAATLSLAATSQANELTTGSIAATGVALKNVSVAADGNSATFRGFVPPQTIAANTELFYFRQNATLKNISLNSTGGSSDIVLNSGYPMIWNCSLNLTLDPSHVYAIGDPYPYKGQPIGVVFAISNGGKNGKAVSLNETDHISWGRYFDENNAGVTGIRDQDNGAIATYNMLSKYKNDPLFNSSYLSFKWIYQTKNNSDINGIWYMPALNEMKEIYNQKATIATNLSKISGATALLDANYYYWTSTEKNESGTYAISMNDGTAISISKTHSSVLVALRPILAF